MKHVGILIASLLLAACTSAQKDYGYASSPEYQHKPKLNQGLVASSGSADALSESAIQKILSSKVTLPKNLTLAIVRLSDSDVGYDFQTIDDKLADQFYKKTIWGPRVQSVIPVPEIMIPYPLTLSGLRQAAALLQADALIVIKPTSYGEAKNKLC